MTYTAVESDAQNTVQSGGQWLRARDDILKSQTWAQLSVDSK